jgi:hypothetical protein
MNSRRYVLVILLGLLIVGAGSALTAHASRPIRHVLQLAQITPDEALTGLCGFGVMRETNVVATVDAYMNRRGEAKRVLTRLDGALRFLANGRTVEGSARAVENVKFSEGGSGNVVLDVDVNWRGHNPSWRGTGNLNAEYDDQGNVVMFATSGPEVSEPAICAALAP